MKDLIKKMLVSNSGRLIGVECGTHNGYVGVPEGHPWFGVEYDHIQADAHGGLTYSRANCPAFEPDGFWWVGFDTCHHGDNSINCNESFVRDEVDRLYEQAVAAVDLKAKQESSGWDPNDGASEHPDFPMADWMYEVANHDTRLGYVDWVKHKVEAGRV